MLNPFKYIAKRLKLCCLIDAANPLGYQPFFTFLFMSEKRVNELLAEPRKYFKEPLMREDKSIDGM